MKKSDIAMIILIASMSVLLSYAFMSQIPLFNDVNKPVTVKTAIPIDPTFTSGSNTTDENPVDPDIFNKDAINPTVKITIGGKAEPSQAQGE